LSWKLASVAGPALAWAATSADTTNGVEHKGHLIRLPSIPSLPLNFLVHAGQVMIGAAMAFPVLMDGGPV
jgi:hypothetical protein